MNEGKFAGSVRRGLGKSTLVDNDIVVARSDLPHHCFDAGVAELLRLLSSLDFGRDESTEGVEEMEASLRGIVMKQAGSIALVHPELGEVAAHLPDDHRAHQQNQHVAAYVVPGVKPGYPPFDPILRNHKPADSGYELRVMPDGARADVHFALQKKASRTSEKWMDPPQIAARVAQQIS